MARRSSPACPPGRPASPTAPPGWPRTVRPSSSTCTTRPAPPKTRSCSPPPTRPAPWAACASSASPKWSDPAATSSPVPSAKLASPSPTSTSRPRSTVLAASCTTSTSCASTPTGRPGEGRPGEGRPGEGDDRVRIALLSYSTKPRGGVVHTLALAEALAAAGQDVTVWTLGRGGDCGFFRPVDPAVRQRVVPFPDGPPQETVGERVLRAIAVLRAAFDPEPYDPKPYDPEPYDAKPYDAKPYDSEPYDIVHAQDCISANAVGRCVR